MKAEERKREVLTEWYFGIGLGYTTLGEYTLIILPFIVILITEPLTPNKTDKK